MEVSDWYSSHYTVNKEGKFEAVESILLGDGKAKYIHQMTKSLNIARERVIAYSDSDLDLPFLYSAGVPVAANPNAKLLKVSKKNAWEIPLDFACPFSLTFLWLRDPLVLQSVRVIEFPL